MAVMTENSRKVFDFLKENDKEFTAQAIAAALGISVAAVTGSVNGLVKKGRAIRREETTTDAEGKAKVVKYISLTTEGKAFDPDAVAEEDK
jgi:DNA-binding MarR family transcriptional regulator